MIKGFVSHTSGKIGSFSYQIGMLNGVFPTLVIDLKKDGRAIGNFHVGDLIELENGEAVRVICAQGGFLKVQPSDPLIADASVLVKALPKILQIASSAVLQ